MLKAAIIRLEVQEDVRRHAPEPDSLTVDDIEDDLLGPCARDAQLDDVPIALHVEPFAH